MAGFRNGRGRDNREAPQGPPQHYGGGPQQQWPPNNGGNGYGSYGPQGAQGAQGPQGSHGEPEYFGDPNAPHPQGGYDPYAANNPGHTQSFSVNADDDPYAYTQGATYQAGSAPAGPIGPRLHWKELLSGVILRPSQTYLQMRDYAMWAPALIVTFLYGLLAIFGFDGARKDVINATLSTAVPQVLTAGVAVTVSFFILGVVTHTLARQLSGDGAWQPTVGLSMLIACLTDTPRLLVAMFVGGNEMFVQLLGWATWLAAGALLTTMVAKSHDLPWPKALAASSIQLIALLSIIKLGTF
ncbi:YIP1 family protein [Streptomyces sp. NPDC050095]|uniref:YIP1 family protein n=1 Tax=unclassified Streptomyces TaxID=2593676 RepID=UPI003419DFF1